MSQLVAYYDESPVVAKGKVEIHQSPISSAAGLRSSEGAIRTSLVYIPVPSEAGPFLVPFGAYDDWRGRRTPRPEATALAGRTWVLRRRRQCS